MAANSSCRRGITAVGKRLANQIWNSNNSSLSPISAIPSIRRAAYSSSVYDKNPDDHIQAGPVPDDVIQGTQSTKYWAPDPQTGVFGPPGEQSSGPAGFHSSATTDTAGSSVLEEKAWFRPASLEDLEKPHPHPHA